MKLISPFKTLLDRYNKTLKFHIDKPKEFIGDAISEIVKTSGAIKSVTIKEDYIEIEIKPTFFDAAAARGFIKMQLLNSQKDSTAVIMCRLIPTSFRPNGLYLITILLSIWTVIGLLISHNFYSFLTVLFGWIMMIVVVHFTMVLNQGKLENYVRYILTSTRLWKDKSFA